MDHRSKHVLEIQQTKLSLKANKIRVIQVIQA
jgi:hypothetical protein